MEQAASTPAPVAIKPTIGRVVLYNVAEGDKSFDGNSAKVLPAIIVRVWSDTMVNLKVLNDGPTDVWKTSVGLNGTQPGSGQSWEWMPFQLGQAAKTEAAERAQAV